MPFLDVPKNDDWKLMPVAVTSPPEGGMTPACTAARQKFDTVEVGGKNGAEGIALLEIYEVP